MDIDFSKIPEASMRRIKKILALAERGVDGEKDTAQSMLANMLKKHGLRMEDISDAECERKWVELSFADENEKTILCQIVRKVKNNSDLMTRRVPRVRTRIWFELSKIEVLEVEFLFAIMIKGFKAEVDKVTTAFIYKNKLFEMDRTKDEDEPERELTPEQRMRARQIHAIMEFMPTVAVHTPIATKP
jgi:hypothetical protein